MAKVPADIIPEIISHLDPTSTQDLHTLIVCNLVSHTFLTASRAILFHTICISANLALYGFYERCSLKKDAIRTLYSVLCKSPHITRLVRVLYIDSGHAYTDEFHYTDESRWQEELLHGLKYFSKVRSLCAFGVASLRVYTFLCNNLDLFPELHSLAISSQCIDECDSNGDAEHCHAKIAWNDNYIGTEPFQGLPDGIENFCLRRRLCTEADREDVCLGPSRDWTLSSATVHEYLLHEFCSSSPSGLPWFIPHLTVPLPVIGMLSLLLRLIDTKAALWDLVRYYVSLSGTSTVGTDCFI
jgi:hypothetical protein